MTKTVVVTTKFNHDYNSTGLTSSHSRARATKGRQGKRIKHDKAQQSPAKPSKAQQSPAKPSKAQQSPAKPSKA
jgi:hypothetical protein